MSKPEEDAESTTFRLNPPKVQGQIGVVVRKHYGSPGAKNYKWEGSKVITISNIDAEAIDFYFDLILKVIKGAVRRVVEEEVAK